MTKLPAPELPQWLADLLPFERYRLKVGAYEMHIMEQGEGLPVLMLHGNPTWGFLWRKVAAELKGERLRLIMPDLVGLGLSEKPVDGAWHSLERHAKQLAELIEALDLEAFILVVQDWGGPIGGAAAALLESEGKPHRMTGAVVLNTALTAPSGKVRSTAFHRFARMPIISELVFRRLAFPQAVLFTTQGDKRSITGATAKAYRWPLRGHAHNAAPLALARMVPDREDHPTVPALRTCERHFANFRGPTEIVWGERDPILGRALKRTRALLPNAKVTTTQAGHFLQEEVPRDIADAIRRAVRTLRPVVS